MTGDANGTASAGPRKLKILMLHGYTQSGPLFRSKTRSLEKTLSKAFPFPPSSPTIPFSGIQLLYPTGPNRLHPADIPGFDISAAQGEERDAWGWWIKSDSGGEYKGISQGLATIRDAIKEAGGIDGVIGFSQGGCAAAFVASLLEPGRKVIFEKYKEKIPTALEYPEGWEELQRMNGQLKFAVSYSGFFAPDERYGAFYEGGVETRLLSVVGSLDSVVGEERSLGLADRCVGGRRNVVMHPGGHFVPVGKDMGGVLVGFVRGVLEGENKEESVEDMDVPF